MQNYRLKAAADPVKPSVLDVRLVCSAEMFGRLRMIKWYADKFTVREHDMLTSRRGKSGFRGVYGLLFSFLKIPDNSFPVKSSFFHFLNDDSRFLLKQATEQGLMCKIRS